jgi:hypothetical protein
VILDLKKDVSLPYSDLFYLKNKDSITFLVNICFMIFLSAMSELILLLLVLIRFVKYLMYLITHVLLSNT